MTDSSEEVFRFVCTRFRATIGVTSITDETPLFSSGIIDSFGVLELIAFLETAFGVDIDPSRRALSEFDTVRKIVALVQGLQQSGSHA